MPTLDFMPEFIEEEVSKLRASRQLLPFLGLGTRKTDSRGRRHKRLAPSKALFTVDAFGDESFVQDRPFFNWTTRRIYDIHGLLLFYDQTLPLKGGNELRVRTAASDLLRSPVWSVRAGPVMNLDGLIKKAVALIQHTPDLEPVMVDHESTVRLICYNYPKLGIMCFSPKDPTKRCIVDLWDLLIVPVAERSTEVIESPAESARVMWSPYDTVTAANIPHLRFLWKRNVNSLNNVPDIPERVDDLPGVIAAAGGTIQETCTTNPELEKRPQQNSFFCAAATAQMILEQHSIVKTQDEIATAMGIVFNVGATPEDQVAAIPSLTLDAFEGLLDTDASFEEAKVEIYENRPFRTGGFGHARACCGFLIEGSGKEWLYIYDPFPTLRADTYYEAWDVGFHANYIYVRPMLYS